MEEKRFQLLLDEFCTNGYLYNYRSTLEIIFRQVLNDGCNISTRYDSHQSCHSKNCDNGRCRIWISLVPKRYNRPEDIIWTILHEFGHHFAPLSKEDENNIDKRIQNEEGAWDWAEQKVYTIDELKNQIDKFRLIRQTIFKLIMTTEMI